MCQERAAVLAGSDHRRGGGAVTRFGQRRSHLGTGKAQLDRILEPLVGNLLGAPPVRAAAEPRLDAHRCIRVLVRH
eukprot:1476908-Prymnesium_polylepis.1